MSHRPQPPPPKQSDGQRGPRETQQRLHMPRATSDVKPKSAMKRSNPGYVPAAKQHQLDQLQQRLRTYKTFIPKFNRGVSPTVGSESILRLFTSPQQSPSGAGAEAASITSPNAAASVLGQLGGPGADHRVVPDPIFEDNIFRIWLSENPYASKEQVLAEIHRRTSEKLESERKARVSHMRQWQQELAELERQQELAAMLGAEEERQRLMEEKYKKELEAKAAPKPPPRKTRMEIAEFDSQKAAWELFTKTTKELPMRPKSPPADYVLQVHRWVEEEWHDQTHRHEVAACKIQCAWRCVLAKKKLHDARLRRQRVTKAVLQSEESAMLAWVVASSEQEQMSQSAVDSRFRALEFYKRQMKAKINLRRKAMRRAEDARSEVENYAATRIQAVWRGGYQRQLVREMLDPTIVANRDREIRRLAATAIQRIVRGTMARTRIATMKAATSIIQRAYREFRAGLQLSKLRRSHRQKELDGMRDFAARIIQRALLANLNKKYAKFAAFSVEIALVQRVCRSYCDRKRTLGKLVYEAKAAKAVVIQAAYRRCIAREEVRRRRAEAEAAKLSDARHLAALLVTKVFRIAGAKNKVRKLRRRRTAAIDIQRTWRGHRGRLQAKQQAERRNNSATGHRDGDAAVMIQAAYRGYAVRKQYRPLLKDTKRRKRLLKLEQEDPELVRELGHDAAKCIQRCYRATIRWPKLRAFVDLAARRIVRFFRRQKALLEVKKRTALIEERLATDREDAAADCIQRAFRQYQARKVVESAREDRRRSQQVLRQQEAVDVLHRFFRRVKGMKQSQALREQE